MQANIKIWTENLLTVRQTCQLLPHVLSNCCILDLVNLLSNSENHGGIVWKWSTCIHVFSEHKLKQISQFLVAHVNLDHLVTRIAIVRASVLFVPPTCAVTHGLFPSCNAHDEETVCPVGRVCFNCPPTKTLIVVPVDVKFKRCWKECPSVCVHDSWIHSVCVWSDHNLSFT